VLTHGHEDHIGAVPHVVPYVDGPVYGTPLTLALVEPKLQEPGLAGAHSLVPVKPRDRVRIGPFEVEFIRVTHSIPDCVALAIHTPVGVVVHTGDFKIDQTPLDGEHFDVHRFAELGASGVLALCADSTNIDRRGFTGSEREVIEAFEEIFTSTTGRLVVAAFASFASVASGWFTPEQVALKYEWIDGQKLRARLSATGMAANAPIELSVTTADSAPKDLMHARGAADRSGDTDVALELAAPKSRQVDLLLTAQWARGSDPAAELTFKRVLKIPVPSLESDTCTAAGNTLKGGGPNSPDTSRHCDHK